MRTTETEERAMAAEAIQGFKEGSPTGLKTPSKEFINISSFSNYLNDMLQNITSINVTLERTGSNRDANDVVDACSEEVDEDPGNNSTR